MNLSGSMRDSPKFSILAVYGEEQAGESGDGELQNNWRRFP